jgi:hypothetical protein
VPIATTCDREFMTPQRVGIQMTLPAQDVKTWLQLIVDRRNKIAHESDMDPANPGFR